MKAATARRGNGGQASGGSPVVPGTTRVDPGDDAVPSRVARGSGGACARRDGGGEGGDGVPVVSGTTRVRPGGDVAPSRTASGGGGVRARRGGDGKGGGGGAGRFRDDAGAPGR